MNENDFSYDVQWSEEDGVYIATSPLPKYLFLAAHGQTPEEAVSELKKIIDFIRKENDERSTDRSCTV